MDDGEMNAYELANELQELDSKLHLINLFKSANMLRQQADHIKQIEQECAAMREQIRYLESQVYGGVTK